MIENLSRFFTAIPPKRRYYQIANWTIATLFGRSLELVHMVEYPRCGGSWMRHMLQDATDVKQYAMDRYLTQGTIIQTHTLPQLAVRKPIVIMRDPRDVMVSLYFKKIHFDKHLRKGKEFSTTRFHHDPSKDTQDDFCDFLKVHLVNPDHPRFHFRQFVNEWVSGKESFVVTYEDCKIDAEKQLRRMVEFVGKQVSDEKITAAVEKNTFENRTLQRSGKKRKPGEADSGQFERRGVVGDWRNVFNAEAAQVFEQYEGQTLIKLGYESDSHWVSEVA